MSASRKTSLQGGQETFAIRCPACGQTGSSVWEKSGHPGGAPVLVSLSMEFYERIGRRKPYEIELVCHRCETVVPD